MTTKVEVKVNAILKVDGVVGLIQGLDSDSGIALSDGTMTHYLTGINIEEPTKLEVSEFLKKVFPWGKVTNSFQLNDYQYVIFEYINDINKKMYHTYIDFKTTSKSYESIEQAVLGVFDYRLNGPNSDAAFACEKLLQMHLPVKQEDGVLRTDNYLELLFKDCENHQLSVWNNYEYVVSQQKSNENQKETMYQAWYNSISEENPGVIGVTKVITVEEAMVNVICCKFQPSSSDAAEHCMRILGLK
ncbi:hypothetical protein bcgnr5378_06750 [Bacillus cereus]|uniref:Uncharacterized protein n=1 Tax=Bacillus cereus TaxID=1396 RepID=A0A164NWH6_BACCE|nr:hypothetical protein [Bacillus cereus]KZD65934.1 hypothetical protein B4088_2691 [Bacillus cereus]